MNPNEPQKPTWIEEQDDRNTLPNMNPIKHLFFVIVHRTFGGFITDGLTAARRRGVITEAQCNALSSLFARRLNPSKN